MKLPGDVEIEAIHRKYAPNEEVLKLVYEHCQIINDIAQQIIESKRLNVNRDLVRAACLLHDVGYYEFFDQDGREKRELNYITHGIRGEKILRSEGMPGEICHIASHHTGTGLTKEEIVKNQLPLPPEDYLAETPEEELVMYADKFHSKSRPPRFNSYDWYRRHVSQFGNEKVEKFDEFSEKFGIPDLAPLMKRYGHGLRD